MSGRVLKNFGESIIDKVAVDKADNVAVDEVNNVAVGKAIIDENDSSTLFSKSMNVLLKGMGNNRFNIAIGCVGLLIVLGIIGTVILYQRRKRQSFNQLPLNDTTEKEMVELN